MACGEGGAVAEVCPGTPSTASLSGNRPQTRQGPGKAQTLRRREGPGAASLALVPGVSEELVHVSPSSEARCG